MMSEVLKKAQKAKRRILMGDDWRLVPVKVPLDIPQLDNILGGGIPLARMMEIFGNWGVGKTFLGQEIVVAFQKKGYLAGWVDVENRFDPVWFERSGIDISKLYVAQPSSGEDALDTVLFMIREEFGVVVLDSVAALVPTSELEGSMDDNTMAALARMFNKALRKIREANRPNEDTDYKGTAFVAINQMRSGIGPFTTYMLPGGQGQQYFASIMLRINKGPKIEEGERRVGFYMKCFTEKNNLAEPNQECELPFRFEGVIDSVMGLVELAIDLKIIIRKGPYYLYGDRDKIMGKLALVETLKSDEEFRKEIENKVYEKEE